MAFPRLQCQLPLSPPAVPHDLDTVFLLLSAPYYTRAEELDILFPTSYFATVSSLSPPLTAVSLLLSHFLHSLLNNYTAINQQSRGS